MDKLIANLQIQKQIKSSNINCHLIHQVPTKEIDFKLHNLKIIWKDQEFKENTKIGKLNEIKERPKIEKFEIKGTWERRTHESRN